MSRVLVTGGVGALGAAVVRRLLADPAYEARVADRKEAPQWMREACEIRTGDLRDVEMAAAAVAGCPCVIHLASPVRSLQGADYSLIAQSGALDSTLLRAAIDHRVERFIYVSCADALEVSAHGFAKLVGERLCLAAQAEHGLPVTICRPAAPARALEKDIAADIVAALCSPAR
ncbi:MAG TPA: NAD-dependent epimerase/dehydratase family protein [Solirubrobacteraceae bacterium]|jgi:nucleoside-diphosphate-sugar epimerase|nr:NAD-dependent epimerase/dehydratase family protein [Solirubrobacteraceae bacterium]